MPTDSIARTSVSCDSNARQGNLRLASTAAVNTPWLPAAPRSRQAFHPADQHSGIVDAQLMAPFGCKEWRASTRNNTSP